MSTTVQIITLCFIVVFVLIVILVVYINRTNDNHKNQLDKLNKELKELYFKLEKKSNDEIMKVKTSISVIKTDLEESHSKLNKKITDDSFKLKSSMLDLYNEIKDTEKVLEDLVSSNSEYHKKLTDDCKNIHDNYINLNRKITEEANEKSITLQKLSEYIFSNLKDLREQNEELRKKIEYFTEIKDDSTRLNEKVDVNKENQIIEEILKNMSNNSSQTSVVIEDVMKSTDQDNQNQIMSDLSETNLDEHDLFELSTATIPELYNLILSHTNSGEDIYIKVGNKYINKEYVGTTQKIESISKLYPNGKVFYVKFSGQNISNLNISNFYTKESINQAVKTGLDILDDEQKYAYKMMEETNNNLFITGKAGTGKSFLLRLFTKGTNKKHLIIAPTGIAALNVGGVTIHSAFGYENLRANSDLSKLKLTYEKKMVLKNIDTIIIDEVSMLRSDVLDQMDLILKHINQNDKLFGGKQVVIFGDLFQLPPIASREEIKFLESKYRGVFFFYAKAFQNGKFQLIELTHNHRQNGDVKFFEILNKLREGEITPDIIETLNGRYLKDNNLRRVIKLLPKKDQVELINESELSLIPAKEYSFEANIIEYTGSYLKNNFENTFPVNQLLKLKLGALVMIVKNDIHKRWVNGTLGIVSGLSENQIKVTIDGIEYEIEKEKFELSEARYKDGTIYYQPIIQVEQYPIVLSYAITIHKSQGMTYQSIACDLSESFENGQSYVALSRCSSLEGLHLLSPIRGNEIKTNPDVVDFYKLIKR